MKQKSPSKKIIPRNRNCTNWLWWKELEIPKKDLNLLPDKNLCIFCFSTEDCEVKFGEFLLHPFSGLRMHYFCLLLSSGLTQAVDQNKVEDFHIDKFSICGFHIKDIFREVKRASRLRCCYCRKQGASIGCVESSCKKKFHFSCGLDKCVLSQFCDNFKSYCIKHRPKQTSRLSKNVLNSVSNELRKDSIAKTSDDRLCEERISQCPICLEDIPRSLTDFHVVTTPCCCDVWLHRGCVQQQAYSSGIHFFRCPVCNNADHFTREMLRMGIYIPERDASWELAHDAFNELLQRHSLCDKETCICPHGRDYNLKRSEWEIVLCDFCGSSGTHIACDVSVICISSHYACHFCLELYGVEGSRRLAESLGIPVEPPRRSRRVRQMPATVEERPKRLRIDMVG